MRKEALFAAIAAAGLLVLVAAWFFLQPAPETPAPQNSQPPVTNVPSTPEYNPVEEDDFESENSGDVTRIIIDDSGSDSSEVMDILSEKVIVDDVIVDKAVLESE